MFGYLDCSSGISGDKFLGALVGAGLDVGLLRQRLSELGVEGWDLSEGLVHRAGIAGRLIEVSVSGEQPARDWRAIRDLIEHSKLAPAVRESSLEAFRLLAEAEAKVHGVDVEDVHFHEVGAVDSIVDVVGAAVGMAELGIGELWASPVRLGFGTVAAEHGLLPVPAPATAELLHGVPVFGGDVPGEMTTPTGAALLRTFVTRYAPLPPMRIETEGWGAGSRELPIPNLSRLSLGEREMGGGELSEVVLLESAVDHLSPEHLAAALDIVLEAGALDVYSTPLQMKKRRLGAEVTVVCEPEDAERLSQLLMRETGTLGVRRMMTWREVAPRSTRTVETTLGTVRVKVSGEGEAARVRPENDDVVAIARETGRPVDKVAAQLTLEAERALGVRR